MIASSAAVVIERARLTSLASMQLLDTPAEPEFDTLAAFAASACGAASAVISLVDDRRAWFKARFCVQPAEVPREHAFCAVAVEQRELLVIPDTLADPRFAGNPLATGDSPIRFYAGAPLIGGDGHCVGTLCVFDEQPRDRLPAGQARALTELAAIVVDLIEARRYRRLGEVASQIVDVTSDAIVCADAANRISFWNGAAERMFGRAADEVLGQPLALIMPERLRERHAAGLARAATGAPMPLAGRTVELTALRADGTEFPIELSLGRWSGSDGRFSFAAIVRDVSGRKVLEREREQARTFLDIVIDNLPAMLFVKDARSREYRLINKAGEQLTGLSREQIEGRRDLHLFAQGQGYEQRDDAALAGTGVHVFESEFVRPAGDRVTLRTKRIVIDGPDAPGQYLLGMAEDVTEVRRTQAEVVRLAHHDSLTGLHNRASYVQRLDELIAAGRPFALLTVDLDRFKAVNDQFGHLVGDEVLAKVGGRLQDVSRAEDFVARIGGDEFSMLIAAADPAQAARAMVERIRGGLAHPMRTSRGKAYLGASIGIGLFPDDATTASELRHAVDLALYRAKAQGRGTTCYYDAKMDDSARERRLLEADLREAINRDRIELAFQPVIALASGEVTSAEALARWTHAERGPVPPSLFIGVAEECGLIEQLGETLLRKACAAALAWPDPISVAVNLSPSQFASGKLCDCVHAVLRDTGLAPTRLQLEVTESLVIHDVEEVFRQLQQLRDLGIKILMDDFGTGYSSLSYFERFPFDKVKVDRSFVASADTSPAARGIIKAVVELGSALGIGVVAEGVETAAQADMLAALGCTYLQGYLYGRPGSTEQFLAIAQDRRG